jgi:hypothetical protein
MAVAKTPTGRERSLANLSRQTHARCWLREAKIGLLRERRLEAPRPQFPHASIEDPRQRCEW